MRSALALFAALGLSAPALAGNVAECEIVIMQYVEDENGGGMDVASFRPAGDFLLGVYDEETELSVEVDGRPIRALMCERNDLVPDEDDYKILATGIPFALSQDFDTNTSDSLTIFFKDSEFRYAFASAYPMGEEMEAELKERLSDFSQRDHGLDAREAESAEQSDETSDVETSDAETSDDEADAPTDDLSDTPEKDVAERGEDD